MKIALAADHAGWALRQELIPYIESLGHEVVDFSAKALSSDDDYPDFIGPAAQAVSVNDCQRGIVAGGSGQGEAIAANRYKGVRCALYYGPAVARKVVDAEGHTSHDPLEIIKLSRLHNDANMLSIAARFVAVDDAKSILKLWLETDFSSQERHLRRIRKLDELGQ